MNHHNPPSPLFQTDGTQPPEPFEQFRDAPTDPPPIDCNPFRDPFAEEVTR